MLLKLG